MKSRLEVDDGEQSKEQLAPVSMWACTFLPFILILYTAEFSDVAARYNLSSRGDFE